MRWLDHWNETYPVRISSEMATDAKRWSVMVKNIDNGHLDGNIRKWLVLGEHYTK